MNEELYLHCSKRFPVKYIKKELIKTYKFPNFSFSGKRHTASFSNIQTWMLYTITLTVLSMFTTRIHRRSLICGYFFNVDAISS